MDKSHVIFVSGNKWCFISLCFYKSEVAKRSYRAMPLAMPYISVTVELKLHLPGESMYIIGWYEFQNSKVIIMSS